MGRLLDKPSSLYRDMKIELGISNYAAMSDVAKQQKLIYHHLQKKII